MKKTVTTLLIIVSSSTFAAAGLIGKYQIVPTGSHANGRMLKSGSVDIYDVPTKADAREGHWIDSVKGGVFKPHIFMRVIANYAVPQSATDSYYRVVLLPYDSAPINDRGDIKSSCSGGDFEYLYRSDELESSRERVYNESFNLVKREKQYELEYGRSYQSFRYLSSNKYELEGDRKIEAMGLVLNPR